eukprot:scpid30195/ scgid20754/ 
MRTPMLARDTNIFTCGLYVHQEIVTMEGKAKWRNWLTSVDSDSFKSKVTNEEALLRAVKSHAACGREKTAGGAHCPCLATASAGGNHAMRVACVRATSSGVEPLYLAAD